MSIKSVDDSRDDDPWQGLAKFDARAAPPGLDPYLSFAIDRRRLVTGLQIALLN
ncbi:MAG: hypothetical protein WDM77_15435 [Steroidobacteraceae bacterium]